MEAALIKKEEDLESMLQKCLSLEQENAKLTDMKEIIRKQEKQITIIKSKNAELEFDCFKKQTSIDKLSARLYEIDQSHIASQMQKKDEIRELSLAKQRERDKCLLEIEKLQRENKNLNVNLERVRNEREQSRMAVESMKTKQQLLEDLEHRLEEAERENYEYRCQHAGAGDRQAGDKEKDESSEIHKLKQDLECTRQELDKTRLRYIHAREVIIKIIIIIIIIIIIKIIIIIIIIIIINASIC